MPAVRCTRLFWILLFVGTALVLFCSRKKADTGPVLAMVDGETITVRDFIRRAEFHIRPDYCQDSSMQAKRICLNSLIAEKLYAREGEKNAAIAGDERLQARLQGIREQTMREELIRRRVIARLNISDQEVEEAYAASQKTVTLEALFVPAMADLPAIEDEARAGLPLAEIAGKHPGLAVPIKREVRWGHVNESLQKEIFSDSMRKDDLLGPLPVENGHGFFKILGWQTRHELSPLNREQEKENVRKRLEDYHIRKNYYAYAQEVMKGKRIDFSPQGWDALVQVLAPVYVKASTMADSLPAAKAGEPALQQIGHLPLLTLDGQVWTIEDLRREVAIHPLEISMTKMTSQVFPRRLQRAIAGLITDRYLTRIAYDEKMDRLAAVQQTVAEWKTAFYFVRHRDQYLQAAGFHGDLAKEYPQAFERFLNPYLETLKAKYDSRVAVDYAELERLELTSLPLLVRKSKGPYLDYVPPFPLVTNSVKANYRKM